MKTINQFLVLVLFIFLAAPVAAQEQATLSLTDPTAPAAEASGETEEAEEEAPGFSLTGYVDAYYQANLSSFEPVEGSDVYVPFGSSFTGATNTFGIGNVNLLAEKTMGKVSFVGQVGFGPRAAEANSDAELGVGGLNIASTIQQLYVAYSPSEAVTFTLGNFGTFVGYEVIDAPANANYSMSYLFSNGPFYHTGAKVDFAIAEGFGAMVGVFNDTDTKFDAVEGKHLGAQLSYESGGFAGYLNAIYGKEAENDPTDEDDDLNEFQIDFTGTFEASDDLLLGLNVSNYATSIDGNSAGGFFGTALYATYNTSEDFGLSFRGEYFANTAVEGDDSDQPSVLGLTLSGDFRVEGLRIIPEVRFDTGSNGFTLLDDAPAGEAESAFAFILAGVYSF